MISQWDSLVAKPVNWLKSVFEEEPPLKAQKMGPDIEKQAQAVVDQLSVNESSETPQKVRVAFLDALIKPLSQTPAHAFSKVKFDSTVRLQKGVMMHMPENPVRSNNTVDLIIQFRGVVPQRFSEGGVNALVISAETEGLSGAMTKEFGHRSFVPQMMDRALQKAKAKYGPEVELGRLAMGSFSAGYAPLQIALSDPSIREKTDAVIVLDGIHYGKPGRPSKAAHQPFVDFAKEAAENKKLMVITHSEIKPTYSSATDAADYIAASVGATRKGAAELPGWTYPSRYQDRAKPKTQADLGGFHVEGYPGGQAKNHVEQIDNLGNVWNRYLAPKWEK